MTIKQIEELTSMPRANIRYYESEGLIQPRRNPDNGYRDYSREDAETLLKIKLLRCLEVSIEELKAIQAGTQPMEAVLRRSLITQEETQKQLSRAMELTRKLLTEAAVYETLDAALYLQLLEGEECHQEQIPVQSHPWRRYWARTLDLMVYGSLSLPLLALTGNNKAVSMVIPLFWMLLLEPVQLRFFGTTLGKAILGLRVTDLEERKLSYSAGLERTWAVLWEGMAMGIPLIEYYFLYKSYQLCEDGEYLPWEWDSELTCKDDKIWRWGLYALVYVGMLAVDLFLVLS